MTGVRVALNGPSWLVLGESFDSGWRATCDGRSLGAPRVLDGYGNGWLAPAGCKQVSFQFAPQSGVNKSYVISAVAAALILLFLLVGAMRRPAPAAEGRAAACCPTCPRIPGHSPGRRCSRCRRRSCSDTCSRSAPASDCCWC